LHEKLLLENLLESLRENLRENLQESLREKFLNGIFSACGETAGN